MDAYRAFWAMYLELTAASAFDAAAVKARLDVQTTGAERDHMFQMLQVNAATGVLLRGDMDHAPVVESNDGTVAVVRDCLNDRTGVFRISDGSRVDQDVPGRTTYVARLHLADGTCRGQAGSTEAASSTAWPPEWQQRQVSSECWRASGQHWPRQLVPTAVAVP